MSWEKKLGCNVNTVKELKKYIKLSKKEEENLRKVVKIHPMSITKYYMSLINKKDKNDPIKKMIVPAEEELIATGDYDTSGECENTKGEGLQHKYDQTALILSINTCAAYCRFCFRKRLVGLLNDEILKNLNNTIKYIKKHKEINNVLISGGDSFLLRTEMIEKFLSKLCKLKQLDFIRFGTRTPVAFPDRIIDDKKLLKVLEKYGKKKRIYVSTHFNHPNEITKQSKEAVKKLLAVGVVVSNQTVLLKDVNDNPDVLAYLLNKLVSIGVLPYYVFQCRPVSRVKHHFQIPFYKGVKIVEDARNKLNGYSKRFRYVMSHRTGKIEIVGIIGNEIYFKYNQAKDKKNLGRFFSKKLNKKAAWLDDL